MFGWFSANKNQIIKLINLVRKIIRKELKDAEKLNEMGQAWNEILNLIGDEKLEKKLEHQLLYQFEKNELQLRKKSNELTERLKTSILSLAKKIEDTHQVISVDLLDAVKQQNISAISEGKEKLMEQLKAIEGELKDSYEIAEHLEKQSEIGPIPNMFCTPKFKAKLNEQFFKRNLDRIENWIINLSNPEWRIKSSEKLNIADLYSFPKRRAGVGIRIIYKVGGNKIIICDIFTHQEYEGIFSSKKRIIPYDPPYLQLLKPLDYFAKS